MAPLAPTARSPTPTSSIAARISDRRSGFVRNSLSAEVRTVMRRLYEAAVLHPMRES
jgi:hypothetical protein